jgi:hypothetical protein
MINFMYILLKNQTIPAMRKILIIILGATAIVLISCGKDMKEWDKIKTTNNIQELENFISVFPKSPYCDSVLIKMEGLIFQLSENSISRSGTFEDYERLMNYHPSISNLTNADEKIEYLRLEADTIEIHGRLLDDNDKPVSGKGVVGWPINKEGHATLMFEDGMMVNPRGFSDSTGNFMLRGHRSFILKNNEFILEVDGANIITKEGDPVSIQTDSTNRIIDVGKIIIR